MKIAFYVPDLSFRGTSTATWDYALYNEELLRNKSVILSHDLKAPTHCSEMLDKFTTQFQLFFVSPSTLDIVLERESVEVLYVIKYGRKCDNEWVLSGLPGVRTVIHCVFDMTEPHGAVYAGVSKSLSSKFGVDLFVPHMITLPVSDKGDLRKELSIPKTARVFGRHGGKDTLNLAFAKELISELVRQYSDLYFIFLNADEWDSHPQIIYLPFTVDNDRKSQFIQTCDAMIVPETLGHTFGLSVGEFSVHNKPIICYNHNVWNTSHIDILGELGLYFKSKDELRSLLVGFRRDEHMNKDYNAYRNYNPSRVMRQFRSVFLDTF